MYLDPRGCPDKDAFDTNYKEITCLLSTDRQITFLQITDNNQTTKHRKKITRLSGCPQLRAA